MGLRNKRRELQAVNGAVGLVLGLGGYVGQLYPAATATFLMFAVWIVGQPTMLLSFCAPVVPSRFAVVTPSAKHEGNSLHPPSG